MTQQPIRVFLLEDDEDLREALEDVLLNEGYEVLSAADGHEAVAKALDFSFDIFVFDVKLPGPDGLEVLAQFKKENPDLLSVVMTGYATEKDTLRALRLGVGDYLKKPFRSKILTDAVRRLESQVLRRRKQDEAERTARSLVVWSLEFLVGGLELTRQGDGLSLVESGRASRRFALGLNFPPESAQLLQCAVLMTFLGEQPESGGRLESLHKILPTAVVQLADEMALCKNEPDPTTLPGLGALCLELPKSEDALTRLEQTTNVSVASQAPQRKDRQRRQMLALGRSMAASGELGAAVKAFSELVESSRSVEAGYAYLELSHIAWSEGDRKRANGYLRELVALLPQLGPQASAKLELAGGLSALGMGLDDGKQLLQRSSKKLLRMGLLGLSAEAVVALAAVSPEIEEESLQQALAVLSQGGTTELLLSYSWWLLKPLLRRQESDPNPQLEKLLLRLIQDAPRSVAKLLDSELSEAEYSSLLRYIESVGASAFEASLQRLFARSKDAALKSKIESIINGMTQQDTPTLRIYSLGPFEVWVGDHRMSEKVWRTYRSRFLLACLAAREGRPVLSETLIEQFWPGVRPDSGKKNLSQTASDLRRTLADNGFEPPDDILFRKHDIIALNRDLPIWHDLAVFREEFEKGKTALESGNSRASHQHLRQAFSLVRGEYLEDCPMEWVTQPRRETERQVLQCAEMLAQVCRELELYPEVLEVASRILDLDPCHQPMHLAVMEAQSALGRPELALKQFERARSSLQLELGVEPSTDLLRAEQIAKMAL